MNDRRESPRIAVELWVEESKEKEIYFQHASNLSVGGLFLDGTLAEPQGTVVNLRFSLPGDDRVVETRAEIVNVPEGGMGMGLRFVGLEEADRRRIEEFVAKRPS